MALHAAATALAAASGAAYFDALWRVGEDLRLARGIARSRIALALGDRRDTNSLYYVFEDAVRRRGKNDCYVCEGVTWSWNDVADGEPGFPATEGFRTLCSALCAVLQSFSKARQTGQG